MRAPRLQNEEADTLTNSDFRHFFPGKRIEVDLDDLPFVVLSELFAEGEVCLEELAKLKVQEKKRKAGPSASPNATRKKAAKLREKDRW